ncbi:MAG: vWA domain-containing protein [Flavobacteriaceae bacterium]
MQLITVLLVILAAAISLAIVLYQYPGIRKRHQRFYLSLACLRFLGIFGILLLLINPKFVKDQYFLEKSNLILLVDNSSSISNSGQNDIVENIVNEFTGNRRILEKFNFSTLTFDRNISASDSLTFNKKVTDIHNALRTVQRTYANRSTALVLLTDGNQTIGTDYEFMNSTASQVVFPVVLGDTTNYEDLQIDRVNVNKYAFLNNEYPVEILIRYQGESEAVVPLTISVNGSSRHREMISLDGQNNSRTISVLLRANTVGMKVINVQLGTLDNEKNTANNQHKTAVEVIDEKTEVTIVSELNHPDIGVLKKSIESNNQRKVQFLKPSVDDLSMLETADILILYQPIRTFEAVYSIIENRKLNYLTITGPGTDWNFLNQRQNSFQKNSFNQSEFVSPLLNAGFTSFDISGIAVEDFPPLNTTLGDLLITKAFEVLLEQRIKGVDMDDPLLAVLRGNAQREAVLFGENIWKWRMQTFREENNFEIFDEFMGKIILYLATDEARERLSVDYETIYQDVNEAKIRAAYFDQAFEFDKNATITLNISGVDNEVILEYPMLLKGSYYEVDLSGLPAGTFNFTISVQDKNISRSGQFSILDFEVEKQFLTTDYKKLQRLAERSGGRSYFADQSAEMIDELIENEQFIPTQKSEQNIVSLIDFKVLLAIVVAAFAAEWFIRKYNGLI